MNAKKGRKRKLDKKRKKTERNWTKKEVPKLLMERAECEKIGRENADESGGMKCEEHPQWHAQREPKKVQRKEQKQLKEREKENDEAPNKQRWKRSKCPEQREGAKNSKE